MTSQFINSIGLVISARNGGDGNSTAALCESHIGHYKFNQFTLIPAILITLSFAATKSRRNLWLNSWKGRPGLIFPMDTLTRSSRISYCCAFGATAFLVYQIVLDHKYAIKYDGDSRAARSFIAMASMFIYGMVFFPLFTSLAIGSVYGYVMGSLYVWMLTSVHLYRIFECKAASLEAKGLSLARVLPSILCLLYLCVSLPVRVVGAFRRGSYFTWREDREITNTLSDIRQSYAGHHVAKLFRKPKVKMPPTTTKERIVGTLMSLVHNFIYKRKRGFRYPARIVSVLFTGVIVVYMLTFEVLAVFPMWLQKFIDAGNLLLDTTIGREETLNETQEVAEQRELFFIIIWILDVVRICLFVSTSLAALFSVVNVLNIMSSYRANLLAVYRGDHSHIPPVSNSSNISHCVNSIKFAGFQVGYIIWGFVIQLVILNLLSFICALFVTLIKYDATYWIILILEFIWPVALTMVLVMVVQYIMARFVFLQERGKYLALDNRSVYFIFTYFMFFYNIFLGLVSCLLRILKAMLLGIVFLCRLDNSTLSRKFEFFDPGFKAYIGYMHVEAEHTHPVMIVFCRLMLLGLNDKVNREEKLKLGSGDSRSFSSQIELVTRKNKVHDNAYGNKENGGDNLINGTNSPDKMDTTEQERRRRAAARFNWHVTYTLLHNPDIRVMRKGYLNILRQARRLGLAIPVSDRQGDVNIEMLQARLVEVKEKLQPSNKKAAGGKHGDTIEAGKHGDTIEAGKHGDTIEAGEHGDTDEEDLVVEVRC